MRASLKLCFKRMYAVQSQLFRAWSVGVPNLSSGGGGGVCIQVPITREGFILFAIAHCLHLALVNAMVKVNAKVKGQLQLHPRPKPPLQHHGRLRIPIFVLGGECL